jgi:hypothetical protein
MFWRPNRFLQIPSAPDVPGLRLPARLHRPPIAGVEQCGPQRKSTDNTRYRSRLHVFLVGKRCAVRRTAVRCGPARRIASARLAGTTPETTSDNGTYHSAPNCGVLLHLTTTGGQSPKHRRGALPLINHTAGGPADGLRSVCGGALFRPCRRLARQSSPYSAVRGVAQTCRYMPDVSNDKFSTSTPGLPVLSDLSETSVEVPIRSC